MGKRGALLELVGLGLELGGLLQRGINIFVCPMATTSLRSSDGKAYLGNLEKALGDVDNPGHLLDVALEHAGGPLDGRRGLLG